MSKSESENTAKSKSENTVSIALDDAQLELISGGISGGTDPFANPNGNPVCGTHTHTNPFHPAVPTAD